MQSVAVKESKSLARGGLSLAKGLPGGDVSVGVQGVRHPLQSPPVHGGVNFVKLLKRAGASAGFTTLTRGQHVVHGSEMAVTGAGRHEAVPMVVQPPQGGNLVRLIKQEALGAFVFNS